VTRRHPLPRPLAQPRLSRAPWAPPRSHARPRIEWLLQNFRGARPCSECGKPFTPLRRDDATLCSTRCKQTAYRARQREMEAIHAIAVLATLSDDELAYLKKLRCACATVPENFPARGKFPMTRVRRMRYEHFASEAQHVVGIGGGRRSNGNPPPPCQQRENRRSQSGSRGRRASGPALGHDVYDAMGMCSSTGTLPMSFSAAQ
jgi:endogenous inhibitor of DNA gyrase (YacG/DUF329 family)